NMSFKWLLAFSYFWLQVPYTCRTFGSGVVQPFNGTLYHVHSDCPFTLTRFTHNRVECAISMKRGLNGLLVHVEIMINKIKTVLEDGGVQVEATKSVRLPYDHTYQHIFPYGIYTKLRSAVLPLAVIWHSVPGGIDTLWTEIELSSDMKGLCGNHLRLTSKKALSCVILDPVSTINTDCRRLFSYTLDCLMHMTPEFIRVCEENIHNFEQNQFVSCSFFKEVVRQCGSSSYIWDIWRKITHCEEPKCAGDLFYVEEGAAFVPTCSNQKTDSYDLTSSCVCPNGKE
uniref:VWFD domain-containing protein n=1 Tax=Neogobius melanostomus TaxID=47308 RepID=A0A8C6UX68_9GOBI